MGNLFDKPPEPLKEQEIPLKARMAKKQLEVYYRDFFQRYRDRAREIARIDYRARCGEFNEQTRMHLRREQFLRELEYLRRKRNPKTEKSYEVVRKIGQGSYGEVFLVRDRSTKRLFAMKKLRKDDMLQRSQVKHVWLERFVLASVGEHPHVVKMYCSFQSVDYLFFIMEYMPGGDLLNMLIRHERLDENWARFYIAELVVAINALHRTGIIHRDIKPDNILFNRNGHVCLSDFGLSKFILSSYDCPTGAKDTPGFIEHVRKGEFDLPFHQRMAAWKAVARNHIFSAVGTPSYIAPEVLNDTSYSEACDWWSVGAILYEMLIGVPPFLSDTPQHTIEMIRNWRQCFELPDWPPSRLSPEARDLISRLICDPVHRLGAKAGLSEFKEHPFFESVDWDNLSSMKAPFLPKLDDDADTRYFDDDIPGPLPINPTSRINTPSTSSAGVNTSGSNLGSSETPGVANAGGRQGNDGVAAATAGNQKGTAKRNSNRNLGSNRQSSSDIEFIGFTYVPFQDDHRSNWQSDLRPKPGSAPPRSVSASAAPRVPQRGRSALQIGSSCSSSPCVAQPGESGLEQRSYSAGPGAQPATRAMSTPKISSTGRHAAALPPYPRGTAGAASSSPGAERTPFLSEQVDAVESIDGERLPDAHGRGRRHLSEEEQARTSDVTSSTKRGVSRKQRSFEGSTVTVEEYNVKNAQQSPAGTAPANRFDMHYGEARRKERERDKENDTDSIVAGLGAVRVTERYPTSGTGDRQTQTPLEDRRNHSIPEMGTPEVVSEVGSTLTPDIQPMPEPGDLSLPMLDETSQDELDDDEMAPKTVIVRTHKSGPSWNPRQETQERPKTPLCPPLDKNTLEERSIEVPSVREVVNFVSDAVEQLEEAADELVATQTAEASAIEAVIRNARSDLSGTAMELHRNLSNGVS